MRTKFFRIFLPSVFIVNVLFILTTIFFFIRIHMSESSLFSAQFVRFGYTLHPQDLSLYSVVFFVEGILLLISILLLIRLMWNIRVSGELYFFILFCFTFAFDGIRLWIWWFLWNKLPEQVVGGLIKGTMFLKLLGDFFLFTASLYKQGKVSAYMGTISAILFLSIASIVFLTLVDVYSFDMVHFFKLYKEFRIDSVGIVIACLTIVNYFVGWKKTGENAWVWFVSALFVLIRNVLYYTVIPSLAMIFLFVLIVTMGFIISWFMRKKVYA